MKVIELMRTINQMIYAGDIAPESEIFVAVYKNHEKDEPESEEHVRDLHFGVVDWCWADPIDEDDTTKVVELRAYEEPIK